MSDTSTIRIGIISAGGMARAHVNALRNIDGVEITAICDPDEERVKEVSAALGIPFASNCHKDVIARDDVDAVVVSSPDFDHAYQSVDALSAGKHVMCEKPMVTTLDECRGIVAAADASDALFMVGQVCRFSPGFVTGKRIVDEGTIGELFLVESEYAHDYTHVEGHGGWRIDPARPRYPFLGGACHAVDLVRWVGGQPTQAFAFSNRLSLKDWPVDDCYAAVFKFDSGAIGKVICSVGCKRDYTMRSVFWGTKGTVICDNRRDFIEVFIEGGDDRMPGGVTTGQTVPTHVPVGIQVKAVEAENRAFISAIRGDAENAMDAREGARTVAACLAAIESSQTGQAVDIISDF